MVRCSLSGLCVALAKSGGCCHTPVWISVPPLYGSPKNSQLKAGKDPPGTVIKAIKSTTKSVAKTKLPHIMGSTQKGPGQEHRLMGNKPVWKFLLKTSII